MPTIDTYRKRAKLLLRWHRERNYSIGEKVRLLERFRQLSDREALALDFTLTLAQEIIAVDAGFKSWAALKAASVQMPKIPRPPAGPPLLKNIVPILLVQDVKASAAFFHDKLNFTVDFLHGAPPFYGSISRDGVCMHLRFVHKPMFVVMAKMETSLISASIEVTNVQGLFEEFKARGVEFAQRLVKQAWGGTDFHVRDLDGNVISFVCYGQ